MPFHHLQINSGTLTALSCDYGAFGALGKGSPPTTSGDIKLIAFGNEEQIDKCAESLSLRRFGLTEHGGKATKCGQQQAVEWSTSPYLCRKTENGALSLSRRGRPNEPTRTAWSAWPPLLLTAGWNRCCDDSNTFAQM